jgi:hypothetical protein
MAARRARKTNLVAFKVLLAEVRNDSSKPQLTTLNLWVVIGPGDQGEAVITLGFPQDF